MTPDASGHRRAELVGVGLVLIASIGFSGRGILIKLSYPYGVDAVTLMMLRMAFSLPFFAAMAWAARRTGAPLSRGDWGLLLGLGFLGYYMSSLLSFMGLIFVPATLERLLLYLTPTIVVLLSALIFRQRVRREHVTALALTYGGIVLVLGDSLAISQEPLDLAVGSVLVLCSTLTFAAYLLGSGTIIPRIGATRFTAYASGTASLLVIGQFMLIRDLATLDLPVPVYVYGAMMAILCTVLPTWAMAEGMRRIGTNRASITSSIGPVSTIVLAALVLGEPATPVQVAGAALVLAGVWMVGRRRQQDAGAAGTTPNTR
jgi:drug/metabolite transporter (DMT)-like permease